MKEVTLDKATEKALIGALATMEVTEDLCGSMAQRLSILIWWRW